MYKHLPCFPTLNTPNEWVTPMIDIEEDREEMSGFQEKECHVLCNIVLWMLCSECTY